MTMADETQPTILVQGIPTDQKLASEATVVVSADKNGEENQEYEEERQDLSGRDISPESDVDFNQLKTVNDGSEHGETGTLPTVGMTLLQSEPRASSPDRNIDEKHCSAGTDGNSNRPFESWLGLPALFGSKKKESVEHSLDESYEEQPDNGAVLQVDKCDGVSQANPSDSEGIEQVALKEVYLPSWLQWIDPTLKQQADVGSTENHGVDQETSGGILEGIDNGTERLLSDGNEFLQAQNEELEESVNAKVLGSKVISGTPIEATEAVAVNLDDCDEDDRLALRKKLVEDLRSSITSRGRYHVDVAEISTKLGKLLDESNEQKQALKLFRDAVSIYSSKLGDDHTKTMETRVELGRVLENAGQYDEAINTYYLVTVMRRALRGEKDPSAADSLVCIANALRKKGDFVQAIKELKRALKIYRESLGDAHSKVSTTVDEIASLYVTIGDFEKSSAILEEVVKLKAATLGMKSKEVSATLQSLATTYECSEDFNKSMKTLKKAYKIETDMGGYSSEGSTNALNRIAHLYEAMGDFNRASIAYLGVLRGRKISLGENNLSVGEAYFKLGHALRETGQHEKSLKCMKEALPIFVSEGVDMHDVERIAETMHQMALINKDKKNLTESARIFKQELGVRRKIGQPEFPTIARTLNHLGVIEFELKNNTRSLKYMVEALTIFQKRGEQGIDCAEVLFNSGLVFEACNNQQRALEAFEEAARIFRVHRYKEDHPHLVKACKKIDKIQRMTRNAAS